MKHQMLRRLLSVVLTVSFCLTAIVPASAAGLFGGDTAAVSAWEDLLKGIYDGTIGKWFDDDEESKSVTLDSTGTESTEFMRIYHVDCGRIYWSVDQLKGIIATLAENDYTHLELAFGNSGFRFLLDDMSVSDDTTLYSSDAVKGAILAGNTAFASADGHNNAGTAPNTCLTQADMDEILTYAGKKGIEIIPLMNTPGHMNTIISAMRTLGVGNDANIGYTNNGIQANSTIDLNNTAAVTFTQNLVQKYVEYFADKGCKYFNLGADEFANDPTDENTYGNKPLANGFSDSTFASTMASTFAEYINTIAAKITTAGMTPMMFNDGWDTGYEVDFNKNILVCYWTSTANTRSSSYITGKGNKIINTNYNWYYVMGSPYGDGNAWCSYHQATNGVNNVSPTKLADNSTVSSDNLAGAMMCLWCDYTDKTYTATEESNVKALISTFAAKNPTYFNVVSYTDESISLVVDGTETITIAGKTVADLNVDDGDLDTSVATISLENTTTETVKELLAVTSITPGNRYLIVNNATGTLLTSESATYTSSFIVWSTTYNGLKLNGEATVDSKVLWTINGYKGNNSSTIATDGYALLYNGNESKSLLMAQNSASLGTKNGALSLSYDESDGYWTISQGSYYLQHIGDGVAVGGSKTYGNADKWTIYEVVTSSATRSTSESAVEVTFTGVSEGTTKVVIDNTRYNITVTAAPVPTIPVQLWQTNAAVEAGKGYDGHATSGQFDKRTGVDIRYAQYLEVPAKGDVATENGELLTNLVPTSIVRYGNGSYTYVETKPTTGTFEEENFVYWKALHHTSENDTIQGIWNDDMSNSDDAHPEETFQYIRYYNKVWEVSNDRTTWIEVTGEGSDTSYAACKDQLAVYYMRRTKVTEEVMTEAADWGYFPGTTSFDNIVKDSSSDKYVLLDFAVKYPDNTRNPDTFPQTNKTLAFHCKTEEDPAIGLLDSTISNPYTTDTNVYRRLNNFRAYDTVGDLGYELYMVTVTMSSDSVNEKITPTQANNGYTYDGEERVVWAIDQETRDSIELNDYVAVSGEDSIYSGCKIGGTANIRGVEVMRYHGALITYYVRAEEKEDSLHVHYIDRSANDYKFYNYVINVKDGTLFDTAFAQVGENTTTLTGNTVENNVGVTQTVSADLKTMLAIPAQYRYSKYTCVEVKRSEDGKDVYLYYTFNNDATFVVDFGLPLTIQPEDIHSDLASATITKVEIPNEKQGTVTFGTVTINDDNSITYTLNGVLYGTEIFTVKYTMQAEDGTTEDNSAEYQISIIPATNVYYEENFIQNTGTNGNWTTIGTASKPSQSADAAGSEKLYGYDVAYDDATYDDKDVVLGHSMNSAYQATLTLDSGKTATHTKDTLSFTFTGTGFDLISACGNDTGMLTVMVNKVDGKEETRVKTYIVDTYFHGDGDGNTSILKNGSTVYQVPVVRTMDLDFGTYNVTVRGTLWNTSGAVTEPSTASTYAVTETANPMRAFLDACGLEDVSVDDVEFVYMDENSVLNGGGGIYDELTAQPVVAAYAMDNDTAESVTATVYVDAFRVYNPLNPVTPHPAYTADNEANVTYQSLYDYVADNLTGITQEDNAILYIEYDSELGIADITEYKNQGPQNEIYLAPGKAIAFGVNTVSSDMVMQISARIVSGEPVLEVGDNSTDFALTTTEMYYDIGNYIEHDTSDGRRSYVVIKNIDTDDGVLAISGLKLSGTGVEAITAEAQQQILASFRTNDSEDFVPDTFTVSVAETVRKNRNFGFGIRASAQDVKTVTIQMQGSEDVFTLTPENPNAVAAGMTDCYTYSKIYKVKTAGTYVFTITAYDENGNSAVIEKTVTVQ